MQLIEPEKVLFCPRCMDIIQFCDDKFETFTDQDKFVCDNGTHYCYKCAKKRFD